jgi:hypothetical protein
MDRLDRDCHQQYRRENGHLFHLWDHADIVLTFNRAYALCKGVDMSHPSKKKGSAFESECVKIAQALGFTAQRAWGSNGQAMGQHEEVDVLIGGVPFQCKRRGRITQDIFPGDNVEGQIIRADRQACAYVVLPLPLFLDKYMRMCNGRKGENK